MVASCAEPASAASTAPTLSTRTRTHTETQTLTKGITRWEYEKRLTKAASDIKVCNSVCLQVGDSEPSLVLTMCKIAAVFVVSSPTNSADSASSNAERTSPCSDLQCSAFVSCGIRPSMHLDDCGESFGGVGGFCRCFTVRHVSLTDRNTPPVTPPAPAAWTCHQSGMQSEIQILKSQSA